ncbi:MAG: dATP pyrophosphohydrolase [Aestuariivirga sp.]|uniref:dATP pyrophosphohydrolase n=1 Tax=Aestuariivirga sp. TaxID=2650926 RepID=UPI0038D084B0
MVQTVSVRPVRGKADLKAFLDVPFALYRDDPHWVAPLYAERYEHLDRRKNPYFRHAEVELFLAFRNGKPVGRISAQLCALRSARYQDGAGQFGFLEAEDDAAVISSLMQQAAAWLGQRGASKIQGPFNFSINDEVGLLIEGFDAPPSIMMGHARPYYAAHLEALGFNKAKDLFAYEFLKTGELPRSLRAANERANADKDVIIRPLNKKKLDSELRIILDIANDAWSGNWGFVPWTEDEMVALGKSLSMLVTGDFVAIAEYRGEPAAMAVTLPDANRWIKQLNGRLLPLGWTKLAWNMFARPPAAVRMPLMGLRSRHHNTALGASLVIAAIMRVFDYHVSRGTREAELSWILEDNLPMRKIIETFGGKPYKTYRIYEKALA